MRKNKIINSVKNCCKEYTFAFIYPAIILGLYCIGLGGSNPVSLYFFLPFFLLSLLFSFLTLGGTRMEKKEKEKLKTE